MYVIYLSARFLPTTSLWGLTLEYTCYLGYFIFLDLLWHVPYFLTILICFCKCITQVQTAMVICILYSHWNFYIYFSTLFQFCTWNKSLYRFHGISYNMRIRLIALDHSRENLPFNCLSSALFFASRSLWIRKTLAKDLCFKWSSLNVNLKFLLSTSISLDNICPHETINRQCNQVS